MTKQTTARFELVFEPPNGLIVQWAGTVSMRSLALAAQTIAAQPSLDDLRYIIGDFSRATGYLKGDAADDSATYDAAAQIIGTRRTNARILQAYIGTDPGVVALIERLYSVADDHIRLFTEESKARDWIGDRIATSTGLIPKTV